MPWSLWLKSCLSFRAELTRPLLRVVQQLLSFLFEIPRAFAPPVALFVVCFAYSCLFTQLMYMVRSLGVQRWTGWSLLLSRDKVDAASLARETMASRFGEAFIQHVKQKYKKE